MKEEAYGSTEIEMTSARRLHVDVREDELGVGILGSHLDGQLGQVAPHAVDGVGAQLGHRADLILIFRLVERLNDLELGPGLGGQLLKALHAQRDERGRPRGTG